MNVVKNHNLECSPIFLVELLHESSLVFLVGLEEAKDFSPYKVTMWSTSENLVIYTSPKFNSKIQAIKLNKKRMLVLERNLLHIFNFSDMKIIHSLEVNNLSTAHIVISHCIENDNIFCYSHFADQGLIKVYDLFSLYLKHTITAHKSKVGRLSINHKGDMVASCSEKGTIIRIFSIITGDKLYTFKRGISSTIIYSMCFNKINNQILVTSENGTVHLFLLEKKENKISSFFSSLLSGISERLLPKEYEDSLGTPRSDISYNSITLKCENMISFNSESSEQAFSFNKNGDFLLFMINCEKRSITLLNECNIKNLKLIV